MMCLKYVIKTIIEVKCRSSWDAYFQIKNPDCKYEKIRILYIYKGMILNYIVDFVDDVKKYIYEIKPDAFRETEKKTLQNLTLLNSGVMKITIPLLL